MKYHEDFKTCEEIARSNFERLQKTGKVSTSALGVLKANFRAHYTKEDAERICVELDRLYNEPSLF